MKEKRKIVALQNNVQVMLNKLEKIEWFEKCRIIIRNVWEMSAVKLHSPMRRNFGEDTSQYTDTITWQTDMIEMRCYTRFNWGYHYILIVIDAE